MRVVSLTLQQSRLILSHSSYAGVHDQLVLIVLSLDYSESLTRKPMEVFTVQIFHSRVHPCIFGVNDISKLRGITQLQRSNPWSISECFPLTLLWSNYSLFHDHWSFAAKHIPPFLKL